MKRLSSLFRMLIPLIINELISVWISFIVSLIKICHKTHSFKLLFLCLGEWIKYPFVQKEESIVLYAKKS